MGNVSTIPGAARPTTTRQLPDRLTGGDAFLLHLEKLVPMHTLKVLILDPSLRGRPVNLADVEAAVRALLPHWPRAGQRLEFAPLHRGRPFLVDDPDFTIADHLDERWAAAPGDSAAFDKVLCELSNRRLVMTRPLWTATLIHGLEGDRQAVAIALHHALADGMAAITSFTAFTTASMDERPFSEVRQPTPAPSPSPGRSKLARRALTDTCSLATGLVPLIKTAWGTRRLAAEFRVAHGMPKRALGAHRNSLSRPFSAERVCATSSLPLSDVKAISSETGATINGVLHAVIADALRREVGSRGEDADKPLLASFGIAADEPGVQRLWGNNVSITWINLHTDVEDPVQRLKLVTESAKNGLELRRQIGLGIQPAAMSYVSRTFPLVIRYVGKIRNIAHVMTANVPGPKEHRWAGDVEVVDFFSLAVLVPPIGLNMTVYSYAGALNIGLLTAPEVHPNPAQLLARVDASLIALC
ncbi:MAG: acyltransferase-like protein superfamily, partial [Mycobacterium sp.]|nr:acyltransferase-like protein superfamily [Mycobacterium sp.]